MLALDNRTPYAAERSFVRDNRGQNHWVVAVKATFDIAAGGKLSLSDEQQAPLLAPEYWGEPGESSPRYDADIGLMKPETDVLINGSAYAPQGRPTRAVQVGLRFERVEKTLFATGPSVYFRAPFGVGFTEPQAFTQAPLRYESAFGGTDTSDPDPSRHRSELRNPIGTGFAVVESALEGKPAPTVMYSLDDPRAGGPAGFSALASFWSPRIDLGGTYDAAWNAEQRPLLPLDWKPESLLCAPPDQRAGTYLRGGESFELVNLTPQGVLRFTLPKIYLAFSTHLGAKVEEHRSKLVTVTIDADEPRLMLVWQTALPVALRQVDHLDKTVIKEKAYVR
jgi:hypothetical protein